MNESLEDWDFHLPPRCIATHPPETRGDSRLLHLPISGGKFSDQHFSSLINHLSPADVLVLNNTKVMHARVFGRRATGGKVEFLFLSPGPTFIKALVKPMRKLKLGELVHLPLGTAKIIKKHLDGVAELELSHPADEVMRVAGSLPIPPYLNRDAQPSDDERYQTCFAGPLGAAAAPTAGLHFTKSTLEQIREKGVAIAEVTLHVGLGTFRPLRQEDIERGTLHHEQWSVSESAASLIAERQQAGGRVIAVGTTSVRTLEAATPPGHHSPLPGQGSTNLFIQPGYTLKSVSGLLTNFHLPRSSLLMLVASFCGKDRLFSAYKHAIDSHYRFYSYGDAMLLL